MNNFSVAMIDTKTNTPYQLESNFTFDEAYSLVVDLRCKRDGNKYWIGKIEWLSPNQIKV